MRKRLTFIEKALLLSILFFLVIWSSTVCLCQEINNIGYAPFNITSKRFNCRAFSRSISRFDDIHISFLYNTFGNDFSCLAEISQDARLKTLQVHLINEPGHRNGRLGKYEFLYSIENPSKYNELLVNRNENLKVKFLDYVQPLKQFIDDNISNSTEVLISPGLESNLTNSAGKVLVEWTREAFPDRRIVFNPYPARLSSRDKTNADLMEDHGLYPKLNAPCVYNIDGADVSFNKRKALGEKYHQESQTKYWVQSGAPLFQLYEHMANKCEYAFLWTAESNGLKDGSFIDPRARNHRVSYKTYRMIMKQIRNLNRRGILYPLDYTYSEDDMKMAPTCDSIKEQKAFRDGHKTGNLLKQSEFRNRGAVLLLSQSFSNVKKATLYKGDTVIDRFKYSGKYKDGRTLLRGSVSPTKYPLKTFLIIKENNSKKCYKIRNPRIRID